MLSIPFTEFRKNASALISAVDRGENIELTRHGKPVAEISPVSPEKTSPPAWKQPGLRLVTKGDGLSQAILQDRKFSGK